MRSVLYDAIRALENRVAESADDATAHYRLGVLLLDQYGVTPEAALLADARKHLARAIELLPTHARSHAALGYAHELAGRSATKALACFREARRLDPLDRQTEVYVLTLLAESGREVEALAEIEAAAARHEVDLQGLRRQLGAAGFPTDAKTLVMNGFIHARNHFRSSLGDESQRILEALQPGHARRQAAAERKRCVEQQQDLARTFDASRVPKSLRALAPKASQYGVGDDHCRPFLLGRLSKQERGVLIRELDANAAAIDEWLDSFQGAAMTSEAAAFMYLALGVEELRSGD